MALFSSPSSCSSTSASTATSSTATLAAGVLWVTLLLATVLGVNRLFAAEREEGGFDGVLLAPIDRTAVFLAKAAALFLYLAAARARRAAGVRDPAARARPPTRCPSCSRSSLLADSAWRRWARWWPALAVETRARDLIVPLLLLPLLVPVLIAAREAPRSRF